MSTETGPLSELPSESVSDPLACPKCFYVRKAVESTPLTECPSCGLIYAKYKPRVVPPIPVIDPSKERLAAKIALYEQEEREARARRPVWVRFYEWHPLGSPKWLVILMCSITWALAWAYGSWQGGSNTPEPNPIGDRTLAQLACQSFVSKRLKAPSTADFAPYLDQKISGSGEGPWTVVAYVDAQNSFGAQLRNNYSCTVQFSANGTQLINLSMY